MSGEGITAAATTVIGVTQQALGLFSEWPLNLVVIGGLIAMGIGLVRAFIPKKKGR